jgi:hypothetical protein
MPGIGGLQHYYNGGSAGAQAGGCPEKGGQEMGLAPFVRISEDFPTGWIDNSGIQSCQGGSGRGVVNGGHFSLRLIIFPALLTLFRNFLTLLFEERPVSAPD